MKAYTVTKTIKLTWNVKAQSRTQAIAIAEDMGEFTADSSAVMSAKEIRSEEDKTATKAIKQVVAKIVSEDKTAVTNILMPVEKLEQAVADKCKELLIYRPSWARFVELCQETGIKLHQTTSGVWAIIPTGRKLQ